MSDGQILNSSSNFVRRAPAVTVYTRERWMYPWQEQPRIFADKIRWGCSPEGGAGTFTIDCGAGRTISQPGFLQHLQPLDLLGHYIKVEVQFPTLNIPEIIPFGGGNIAPATRDPVYWYGIISEAGGVRDGAREYQAGPGSVRVLTRTQALAAVGLEYLLDRIQLDKTYTMSQSGGSEVVQVRLPIAFNEPHKFAGPGNRSPSVAQESGVYVFTDELATASAWSTRNIVEYLVEYFRPIDWLGMNHIPCSLSVNALATLPTWDRPIVPYAGKTLRDVLNQLCDRRRNMAWQLLVNEDVGEGDNHELKIDLFSFNPVAILLPSGAEQAENFDQVQLDFDSALDVRASLTESVRHKVDQVVVRGARRRSCFSLSHDDGTLVKDWTSANETSYKSGPSELPSTSAEQQRAVIEYRRQDDLRQVYSYFKVPDDWDFEVGDGLGDATSSNLGSANEGTLPIDPDMHDVLAWGYLPALRFLRELFAEMSDTAPSTSAQEAPAPFAVIEVEDGTYRLLDQLAETAGVLDRGHGKGRMWSASLAMRADAPGIIVKVSGAQQLVLAATDFPSSETTAYELAPQLDYHDMIVTVACETWGCVTAEYPAPFEVDNLLVDQATRVYVDIGEAGRLDYVVPGTVVGIEDGDLVRDDEGGYVRDDREWMEDLARYVYQWYGVKRQAFVFSMEQILDLLSVGQLITSIGTGELEEEVNSVVVGVTFDFDAQRTSVDTSFANLDVDSVAEWFGTDDRAIARARRGR